MLSFMIYNTTDTSTLGWSKQIFSMIAYAIKIAYEIIIIMNSGTLSQEYGCFFYAPAIQRMATCIMCCPCPYICPSIPKFYQHNTPIPLYRHLQNLLTALA